MYNFFIWDGRWGGNRDSLRSGDRKERPVGEAAPERLS